MQADVPFAMGWMTWHASTLLLSQIGDPVDLRWQAPSQCPDASFVQEQVRSTVGPRSPEQRGALRMRAEIEAAEGRYRLRVWFDDDLEPRELAHGDCLELARTAAFLAAIAIDPRVSPVDATPANATPPDEPQFDRDRAPEDARPSSGDGATIATPTTSAPPSPNGRSRRAPIAATGHVVAGFGLGPSPRITAVVGLGVGLLGRSWRLELEAHEWTPRRLDSRANPAVGLVAQLWSVGVRGCGVLSRGRLDAPLCGLLQSGLVHAEGVGALDPRRARQPWLGVGAGVGVIGWLAPRLGLGCAVDVLWVAVHGGFASVPSGDIDRVGQVAFATTCGLHWRHRDPAALETPRAGQPGR